MRWTDLFVEPPQLGFDSDIFPSKTCDCAFVSSMYPAAVPLPSASSEGLFAQAPIARIEKVNANAMATVVKDFFMIFLRKIDCILIVTIFYAKIN